MALPPDRYRYGAFDDGPDPLAEPVDLRSVVDDLGRSVLKGSSVRDALRELLRRGASGRPGLDELRKQIQQRRREVQQSGKLSGVLDGIRATLDQALAAEREALAALDTDDARFAEMVLEDLPPDVASAVRELSDHTWQSPEAETLYRSITDRLREQVLDRQFQGLSQALQQQDPAAMARLRDMLADLNSLLDHHARGQDTTDEFGEFLGKHGEFFPENPATVEELVDLLAKRQAEAQRLMDSLTPEQRAELSQLMDQAFRDVGLDSEMSRLTDNLTALRPGMFNRMRPASFDGDQPLDYGQAVDALAELSELEALDRSLGQDRPGSTLDDVDVDALARHLTPQAAASLRDLRELEKDLERQGFLSRNAGQLQLSAKALRRLGESALKHIMTSLSGSGRGEHDDHRSGGALEPTGAFLPWEIGSDRPIDAVRTVTNAVRRSTGGPLLLQEDDFESAETERRTTAAVALCVDLSFSMVMEDRWEPMKRTALALAHLITTRYRSDALQIIGFDLVARPLTLTELAALEPDYVKGTNLQHALRLSARHLRRHPGAHPVIMVVTDGEPTAHLEAGGHPTFSWPPSAATVRETVAEVDEITKLGADLNIFMLGDDPGLVRFMDGVARRSGGRVLSPDTDRLGEFVVADYLRARRGRR